MKVVVMGAACGAGEGNNAVMEIVKGEGDEGDEYSPVTVEDKIDARVLQKLEDKARETFAQPGDKRERKKNGV